MSYEAALLLARIPSFYLLAGRQKRLYERTKDLRARGEIINKENILELRHMANTILLRQWKMDISRQNILGQRVIKALQPCLEEWVNRLHGSMSFHLTQLFTAHGSFDTYLFKIRKVDSETCPHCNERIDDAEHTMKYCPVCRQEREELVQVMGNDLVLRTLVPKMIRYEKNWKTVDTFARKVLTRKEVAERERDARRGAVVIGNKKTVTIGNRRMERRRSINRYRDILVDEDLEVVAAAYRRTNGDDWDHTGAGWGRSFLCTWSLDGGDGMVLLHPITNKGKVGRVRV